VQRLHVAAFWLRLAGNILLDLFSYVHANSGRNGCLPFRLEYG
jgi:hypothetical protein